LWTDTVCGRSGEGRGQVMRLLRMIRRVMPARAAGATRAWIVRLCVGALALPVVLTLTVVPSPLHTMAPLQAALVVLFNLGCLGLAAVGLNAMAWYSGTELEEDREPGESRAAVVNKRGDCVS